MKEGFCWNNVLNPNARLLKVKMKSASVNDVGSMSLYPIGDICSPYLIALLNSNLLFDFYREFVNCTVNIQINDLRQMPVIIPSLEGLNAVNDLVLKVINIKKRQFNNAIEQFELSRLCDIESQIDKLIESLYKI